MKKFISTVAIALLPILSFAQNSARPGAVQTSFGRYGSDCSSGRGACSFTVEKAAANESASARNCWKVTPNTIVLEMKRSSIFKEDELRIAGKPFAEFKENEPTAFVQQDLLVLDAETLKNLVIDSKLNKIKTGNCPMTITAEKVEIVFTLSSN